MPKNITRREAAKAITLGTAAALVSPAALADANPDADILSLARELKHIETAILPPLEKAFNEAEATANETVAPFMNPPRLTPDMIDALEAESLAKHTDGSEVADLICKVMEKKFPGDDIETAVKKLYIPDRERWNEYANWNAARLQAEKDVGLFEKEQRLALAEDDAEAIREKICSTPARTETGYMAKLRIAMDGMHPDTIADPEYVTDKALVSLMRDLQAGA